MFFFFHSPNVVLPRVGQDQENFRTILGKKKRRKEEKTRHERTSRPKKRRMVKTKNDDPRKEWGPAAWKFFHAAARGFPEKPTKREAERAKSFFLNMCAVLPCNECRHHCDNNMKTLPPQTHSRKDMMNWLDAFHNKVNKASGKKPVEREEDSTVGCACGPRGGGSSGRPLSPHCARTCSAQRANTIRMRWMLGVGIIILLLLTCVANAYR